MQRDDPTSEDADQPFGMTTLEEQLRGPDCAAVHARCMSRLAQLDADIDGMVRTGLRPEAFTRARSILNAIRAAKSLLAGAG